MYQARTEPRASNSATVRIFGIGGNGQPDSHTAITIDTSRHGVRLTGVLCWEQPGETIGVTCGTEKARFRIVWVGKRGSKQQGEVGLLCVEHGKYIFGIAPPSAETGVSHAARPQQRPPLGLSPPTTGANNRRKDKRYRATGGVNVREQGAQAGQWAMLHDISGGGCYVETTTPLLPNARVDTMVHVGDIQMQARGYVTVSHRLVGMGMKFTEMSPLNRERLRQLIAILERTGAEA